MKIFQNLLEIHFVIQHMGRKVYLLIFMYCIFDLEESRIVVVKLKGKRLIPTSVE